MTLEVRGAVGLQLDETELSQIRDDILADCIAIGFVCLVEESGSEVGIRTMSRHSKHSGMALAINARKRFEFKGNGPEAAGIPLLWSGTALSKRDAEMEVHERGVIVLCRDCPIGGRSIPQLCVAASHGLVAGICAQTSPKLSFVYTDHLSDGGKACRCVIKEGSEAGFEDLGRLVQSIRLKDMTDDEVSGLRAHVLAEMLNITVKSFLESHGPERMRELMLPKAKTAGMDRGKSLTKRFCSESTLTAQEAHRIVCSALMQMGKSLESDVAGEGQITECPLSGFQPEGCELIETYKDGMLSTMASGAGVTYDAMQSKGSATCHWKLSVAPRQAEGARVSASVDLLTRLQERLVNGELSIEEYDKIMDRLRRG